MLNNITINRKSQNQLYLQISGEIGRQIENGVLKKGDALPSINVFSEKFGVARDTIERAYKELKKQGYITGVNGKGYYVVGKKNKKIKVLFIFNKISSYKKIIYDSFHKTLGKKITVDIQIHHYNPLLLKDILDNNLGKYSYYVVMPYFEVGLRKETYLSQLKRIPANQLVILDRNVPELKNNIAVYQDFRNDICHALESAAMLIKKYKGITLFFPEHSNHPIEIIEGVKHFTKESKKSFKLVSNPVEIRLTRGMLYIVITDDHLAVIMKKIKKSAYQLGKDIGIISFNETELKDLLDVTVISTDFELMGHTAASLIQKKQYLQIKNPFKIIVRGSL